MRFLNDNWWKGLLELLHTIWCIIEYPHCQRNKNSEKRQKNLCRSSEMLMDTVDMLRVTAPQYISSKRICHQGLELRCRLQIHVNHTVGGFWSFVVKCCLLVEAPQRIESHLQQARATYSPFLLSFSLAAFLLEPMDFFHGDSCFGIIPSFQQSHKGQKDVSSQDCLWKALIVPRVASQDHHIKKCVTDWRSQCVEMKKKTLRFLISSQ